MVGQKITGRQKDISRLLREKNITRLNGQKKIIHVHQKNAANKRRGALFCSIQSIYSLNVS
jgi:hypothetical protein